WTTIDHPTISQSHSQTHSQGLVSLASSYPDISFPPSPPHAQFTNLASLPASLLLPPPSNTQAQSNQVALTPTLLTLHPPPSSPLRTRLITLGTSLTINFLLPFINGIMLGFGEIFARNLVGWLGWSVPAVGAVGIRAA